MTDEPGERSTQRRVADQIFVVSAAMVGVCLTLMGLVAIIASLDEVATVTDELLAADAMVFLVACLASYFALRSPASAARRYERIADLTFIVGMVAVVIIGAVVAMRLI